MSFKKILLGSSAHKSYTHNMSFDNNTTMDFGVLQPLLCQYMEPHARITVDARQLVRLAPMPLPTFARMELRNYARYVKMTDVVPYHECLLSKLPYYSSNGVYTPTQMPYTDNRMLMYHLITSSRYTLYKNTSTDGSSQQYSIISRRVGEDDPFQPVINAFNLGFGFGKTSERHHRLTNLLCTNVDELKVDVKGSQITPEGADEVIFFNSASWSNRNTSEYMMCVSFSQSAKILRKQLIGLGYSLTYEDVTPLSIAPLLAYYKSWFDSFGLTRERPFETTNCFRLIKFIEDYKIDFSYRLYTSDFPASYESAWDGFLDELSQVYYSDSNSYLAAHRSSINNKRSYESLSLVGTDNNVPSSVGDLPSVNNFSKGLTQVSLDLLRRLTRYVSKDSVIGSRLSDWVKVHYGADVSNSLFEQSNRLQEWRTFINVDDVMSQSDTVVPNTKQGEYLGAYAGKGIGYDKSHFTFTSPVHGFVFVMSCIVPDSNIFLGNDPTLYGIDLDSIPRPEFDALGYEVTDGNVFYSDNGISINTWSSSLDVRNRIPNNFGFIPRYSGYKVKKNVVNGDMYCGPAKTDFHPYYLDKLISSRSTNFGYDDKTGRWSYYAGVDSVIGASSSWQQICRYSFMGDYNRIFYNSSNPFAPVFNVDSENLGLYPIDDNFIVQTVFDVKLSNWMKPIQQSYDTVDDTDNSAISVTTN